MARPVIPVAAPFLLRCAHGRECPSQRWAALAPRRLGQRERLLCVNREASVIARTRKARR